MEFLVELVLYKRPADLCNLQVVKGFWQLDMRGFTCQPLGVIQRNFCLRDIWHSPMSKFSHQSTSSRAQVDKVTSLLAVDLPL